MRWTPARSPILTRQCFNLQKNVAEAGIQLVQASVPETDEIGALSSIVNTHWSLLYWEPMRVYFQKGEGST
jgi:hypothetical protein